MGSLAKSRRWLVYPACLWVLFVFGLSVSACGGGGSSRPAAASTSASSSELPAVPPPPTNPPDAPASASPTTDPYAHPVFSDPLVPNVGPAGLSGSVGAPLSGLIASTSTGGDKCGCAARIVWGEGGGIDDATATSNDHGGVDITGSHTYNRAGTYYIEVGLSLCQSEPCHGAPIRETLHQTITISS